MTGLSFMWRTSFTMNQIYIQNISDSLQSTAVPAIKLMKHDLFERHSIQNLVILSKILLLEPERVSTFFSSHVSKTDGKHVNQ